MCTSNENCGKAWSGFVHSILHLSSNNINQDLFFRVLYLMAEGTITRLTDRGFGFIAREGETKDLFFHSTELKGVEFNELQEGDKVTFEVTNGPKGPAATNVGRV